MKLYCVDSFDGASWSNASLPLEERARAHGRYEAWILDQVVPWIHDDCGGAQEIATLGVSLGAFHAVNFALKRADLFPLALGLSGNYDPGELGRLGRARRGRVLQQPARLRRAPGRRPPRLAALAAQPAARRAARGSGRTPPARWRARSASPGLLGDKGIRCELDLWGHDVPHDWPSWRAQLAHHLPRFC